MGCDTPVGVGAFLGEVYNPTEIGENLYIQRHRGEGDDSWEENDHNEMIRCGSRSWRDVG